MLMREAHFLFFLISFSKVNIFLPYCVVRLVAYSSVKKDATSLAGKLVQPVLQLLSEDDNASVWLDFFPS